LRRHIRFFSVTTATLLGFACGNPSVTPRLLTQQEYLATMPGGVVDITGRESDGQPEGVIDIDPYLAAVPRGDLQGAELIADSPPAMVYRTKDGSFDHVLYRCNRRNVFLVIVVRLRPDRVHGHYLLDLNKEYGLQPDSGVR
jgi:hypothetical protein